MSKILFYTNPMSRGQIARWALHEAGANYDQKIVEYGDEMKSDEYRAINPMGKVPAIVDDGKAITECAAICAYLADKYPEAVLAPTNEEKADYYRWMFFGAGPLEAATTNKSLGFEVSDEQQRMAGYGNYDLTMKTLSDHFAENDYVCGDRFTMADVYVGSHVNWGMQFGSITETPILKAYSERLQAREAYQAAKAVDMELMPAQPA